MKTRRIAIAALFALGGCATTGTGRGTLEMTGKAGEMPGPVHFDWRAEPDATNGEISATLPDGRVFRGRFIQATSATRASYLGNPYWASYGYLGPGQYLPYRNSPAWAYYGAGSATLRTYSGHVHAVLDEAGGARMSCDFELVQPTDGPARGGTGNCETTDGERITNAVLRGD